jgi:integrase
MSRGAFVPSAEAEATTVAALLDRYVTEISATKRSEKSDKGRAKTLTSHIGAYKLTALTTAILATYRNTRLKVRAPQTVVHELNLLNRALRIATSEWGIVLPGGVPRIVKPKKPEGRDRRVTQPEIDALISGTESPPLAAAIGLAVETAMRRSEILSLQKERIDRDKRTAFLPKTKTDRPRTVPLSSRALAIIEHVWKASEGDTGPLFAVTPGSATQAFVRAVRRERKRHETQCRARNVLPETAFMVDLVFHDLRHEATSRLFERGLGIMEVAAITGHKTLDMLKRYTHLRAEDLAKKLG